MSHDGVHYRAVGDWLGHTVGVALLDNGRLPGRGTFRLLQH